MCVGGSTKDPPIWGSDDEAAHSFATRPEKHTYPFLCAHRHIIKKKQGARGRHALDKMDCRLRAGEVVVPGHVVESIVEWCPLKDVVTLSMVCRGFNRVARVVLGALSPEMRADMRLLSHFVRSKWTIYRSSVLDRSGRSEQLALLAKRVIEHATKVGALITLVSIEGVGFVRPERDELVSCISMVRDRAQLEAAIKIAKAKDYQLTKQSVGAVVRLHLYAHRVHLDFADMAASRKNKAIADEHPLPCADLTV